MFLLDFSEFQNIHDAKDMAKAVIVVLLFIFLSFIAITFAVIAVYTVLLWTVYFIRKLCNFALPRNRPAHDKNLDPPTYDSLFCKYTVFVLEILIFFNEFAFT